MTEKNKPLEVFPIEYFNAYIILMINSCIYFLCITLLTAFDNEISKKFQNINYLLICYLLILSLCRFYITLAGIIFNDMFRVFFNIYINFFIIVYVILALILTFANDNINTYNYITLIPIIIILIFESIYFYRFYYKNLPNFHKYYYKKLGVSEKLNEAYKIRQKLIVMKEIFIFRLLYLLGTIILIDTLKFAGTFVILINLFVSLVIIYVLQLHLNCENKKIRITIGIIVLLSFLKEILVLIFYDIFYEKITIIKISNIFLRVFYCIIYILTLYYGYQDYKLFGSGLKDYIKRGSRRRIRGARLKIE